MNRKHCSYQLIYRPNVHSSVLSQAEKRDANLRRIFQEKGHNFFEINDPTTISSKTQPTVDEDSFNLKDNDPQITEESDVKKTMSIEELFAMRSDIMPQLQCVLSYHWVGFIYLTHAVLRLVKCSTQRSF